MVSNSLCFPEGLGLGPAKCSSSTCKPETSAGNLTQSHPSPIWKTSGGTLAPDLIGQQLLPTVLNPEDVRFGNAVKAMVSEFDELLVRYRRSDLLIHVLSLNRQPERICLQDCLEPPALSDGHGSGALP